MKEKILSIASDLREGFITTKEAQNLLLVLFGVSKSVCLLKYDTKECERYNTVKTCKHCPWEQTVC